MGLVILIHGFWPYEGISEYPNCSSTTMINTGGTANCTGYATVYTFYISSTIVYEDESTVLSWFYLKNNSDPDGCGNLDQVACESTKYCKYINSQCHQVIGDHTNADGKFRKAIFLENSILPLERNGFLAQLLPVSPSSLTYDGTNLGTCDSENWGASCSNAFARYLISADFNPAGTENFSLGNPGFERKTMRSLQYASGQFNNYSNNPSQSLVQAASASFSPGNSYGSNAVRNHFLEPDHLNINKIRNRCHFLDIGACGIDSCPATSVANSDYSSTNSVTGDDGESVSITCDLGYRANGTNQIMTCSGTSWDPVVTCAPDSCTAISVANSNYKSPPP